MNDKHHVRLQSKKKLGAIVVALVVVAVLALAYYYTEGTNHDVHNQMVLAVCTEVTLEQQGVLAARLSDYVPPDDRPAMEVRVFSFAPDYADPQGEQLLELIDVMNAGDPNLYLLDDKIYALIGDRVALRDLSVRYPGNAALVGTQRYAPQGQPFAQNTLLQTLTDCCFSIQKEDSHAVTKDAQTQQYYDYQLALLDNIVYDQPGARHDGIFS